MLLAYMAQLIEVLKRSTLISLNVLLLLWGAPTLAQPAYIKLSDLSDPRSARLTAEEVRALLVPGSVTELMSPTQIGRVRRWNNSDDGEFFITYRDIEGRWTNIGRGSFQISDDGSFCQKIQWVINKEQWCAPVYRQAGAMYLSTAQNPGHEPVLGRMTIKSSLEQPPITDADLIGSWHVDFAGSPTGYDGRFNFTTDGGTWRRYAAEARKFTPCFGEDFRVTVVERSPLVLTIRVASSEVVRGCEDEEYRLMKVDKDMLQGQKSAGAYLGNRIRLTRR